MSFELHRHDARHLSELLKPESVDLIVTSPPYFALRSYRDTVHSVVHPDGTVEAFQEHYDGQLGSEATPGEFIDNLIACTADWLKVLKPTGSLFVNLGDKYAGSGGHNNAGIYNKNGIGGGLSGGVTKSARQYLADNAPAAASRRNAPDRYNQNSDGIPAKSRMGLPWRYALRCIDELGLILRADIIWNKPNGLPESVTDRVRISHEYLFHFTRQGRYYASVDEVREPQTGPPVEHFGTITAAAAEKPQRLTDGLARTSIVQPRPRDYNPLGKVPGSVWTIPSEPLQVPDHLGVDHFAAYPSELVRRIILGWTPNGYCTACGEARRAVVTDDPEYTAAVEASRDGRPARWGNNGGAQSGTYPVVFDRRSTITGYACACTPYTDHPAYTWIDDRDNERYVPIQREYHFAGWTPAPTTPATVADPFVGTGTTCAVAHHLGRHGVGVDLSSDYLRLAEWRCSSDHRLRDKVLERSDLPAAPKINGQLDLFGTSP